MSITPPELSSYVKGTKCWFPDKEEGWISAELTEKDVTKDGKVNIRFIGEDGRAISISTTTKEIESAAKSSSASSALSDSAAKEVLPPLRNPPLLEATEDLTNLSYLNEPAVLHTIRTRYSQRQIYTYSGIVLVAMNPFSAVSLYANEIVQAYAGRRKGELEPHLFAIAEDAYRCMIRDQRDQTIIVSGESGAGKTVSAKYIMRYFATVDDPERPGKRKISKDGSGMSEVEQQILATNPIMEAFGNAKTTRNDNSSRFGKYIEILFDGAQNIVGARMRTYLLERSRLVYQPETERNYHIFYQLLAGAPTTERRSLQLKDITTFHYLNQGGPNAYTIPNVNDAEEFKDTQNALTTVGIRIEQQWQIFKLLAALLHLGNIEVKATRSDAIISDDDPSLTIATNFLGMDKKEFAKWTIKKQIATRTEKIITNLNLAQATIVRDSVAKYIYACLFDWLVSVVNESLTSEGLERRVASFIGVLDIYGFEHFKKNSFEQFCINYANEKLQQEFNAHVFKLEQEEYVAEKIDWTFIDFSDNQPCIDLIESKLGILSLLDEECRLPAGTDASFAQKLYSNLDKPPHNKVFKKARFGATSFTVTHYAHDVTYDTEGFLEKNKDTVPDEHLALLNSSSNSFLKDVMDRAITISQAAKAGEPPSSHGHQASATTPITDSRPMSPSSSSMSSKRTSIFDSPAPSSVTSKRTSVRMSDQTSSGLPGPPKRGGAAPKKPTLGYIFKSSLISLMDTIDSTNVHYIRCIKPNEAKKAWEFEAPMVLSQLRACGVLETIRISCAGYPTRWTFPEFADRYYMLVTSNSWDIDLKDLCTQILNASISEPGKYQIGLTKLFFRAGMLAYLENCRMDRLNYLATLMQKNFLRHMYVIRYQNLRTTVVGIQTAWRAIAARKEAERTRKETAAIFIQKVARAYVQKIKFQRARKMVVSLQAVARAKRTRLVFREQRLHNAASLLQSLLRGARCRNDWARDRKRIILIQSCVRRRAARQELKVLKQEAKSVSHFKEVSYKLENKVVELTQNLQKRSAENRELQTKLKNLEKQLQSWVEKYDDADAKAKNLYAQTQKPAADLPEFQALEEEKKELDKRLESSLKKISDQDAQIQRLTDDFVRQTQEMEERQKLINSASKGSTEDQNTISSLRTELSTLREQLGRAVNANQPKGARMEGPPVFNMATGRSQENGAVNGLIPPKRRPRRHSAAGAVDASPEPSEREYEEPRAVSVAFPQDGRAKVPGGKSYVSQVYDDPAEEIIKLLEEEEPLDEDVLNGIIRHLKIPAPSLQNPPSPKEVLFPAHLISLVTNEMWKYGLMRESERFLANVMQTIQQHVMSFQGEDAIIPGVFWLSNVHEILSFVCIAESDILQGIGPGVDGSGRDFEWDDYERLVTIVKHDLDSLEYNIYHTWMQETKKKLHKMVIPALIESQSLPGFVTSETGGGRLFNRLLQGNSTPAFNMDDILNLLNRVWKSLKSFYVEATVVQQVVTELLKLIGVTSFNDLLMRRNFNSWKRAMQIQYNITRLEEWCKAHEMPEGTLQLEHLMQATKLLQLKKATLADIEIIYDVCWLLSPSQIAKLVSGYFVADYENPISPEMLRAVASRVVPNDRNDHLLLPPEVEEAGPYEVPLPREVMGIETYVPAWLQVGHVRRLVQLVS